MAKLTAWFACARSTQIEVSDAGATDRLVFAHGTVDRTLNGSTCYIVIISCYCETPQGFIEQLSVVIGQVATQAV